MKCDIKAKLNCEEKKAFSCLEDHKIALHAF